MLIGGASLFGLTIEILDTGTPSTAAALIVFELVRRKFGEEIGLASIQHDGFEIVL